MVDRNVRYVVDYYVLNNKFKKTKKRSHGYLLLHPTPMTPSLCCLSKESLIRAMNAESTPLDTSWLFKEIRAAAMLFPFLYLAGLSRYLPNHLNHCVEC